MEKWYRYKQGGLSLVNCWEEDRIQAYAGLPIRKLCDSSRVHKGSVHSGKRTLSVSLVNYLLESYMTISSGLQFGGTIKSTNEATGWNKKKGLFLRLRWLAQRNGWICIITNFGHFYIRQNGILPSFPSSNESRAIRAETNIRLLISDTYVRVDGCVGDNRGI